MQRRKDETGSRKNRRTGRGKPPVFVLARFGFWSHPRFKRGISYRHEYLWWSKPVIRVYERKSFRIDQPVGFNNRQIRVEEFSEDKIVLQIERKSAKPGEDHQEIKEVPPNRPVLTGHDANLYDASSESYFGCWTSRSRWKRYYLKIRWERWKDDRKHKLINLPTYFAAWSIRRAFQIRYHRLRRLLGLPLHWTGPKK